MPNSTTCAGDSNLACTVSDTHYVLIQTCLKSQSRTPPLLFLHQHVDSHKTAYWLDSMLQGQCFQFPMCVVNISPSQFHRIPIAVNIWKWPHQKPKGCNTFLGYGIVHRVATHFFFSQPRFCVRYVYILSYKTSEEPQKQIGCPSTLRCFEPQKRIPSVKKLFRTKRATTSIAAQVYARELTLCVRCCCRGNSRSAASPGSCRGFCCRSTLVFSNDQSLCPGGGGVETRVENGEGNANSTLKTHVMHGRGACYGIGIGPSFSDGPPLRSSIPAVGTKPDSEGK